MGEQLKPCPFCGARAEILGADHLPYVCCENCGGSSDEFRTAERAAEDWNRRTPDPATQQVVEACEPFASYGEALRGQRVRHDEPLVELWGHKITGHDLIRAANALSAFRKGEGGE